MTETVLTREQIEKLSLDKPATDVTAFVAPLPHFTEDFLVRDSPGYAGDRNCQHEEFDQLFGERFQLRVREQFNDHPLEHHYRHLEPVVPWDRDADDVRVCPDRAVTAH